MSHRIHTKGLVVYCMVLAAMLASCAHVPTEPVSAEPGTATAPENSAMQYLRTEGLQVVNEDGEFVQLRGCNSGAWLLIEPWIIGIEYQPDIKAERDIWDLLAKRFGAEKKVEFIKSFRNAFFTEADVERIAEAGMNCLRVPIWWRAVSDPDYAGDMKYLDDCVAWCAKNGVYVILDLHGAPGRQSETPGMLGEQGKPTLWTSDERKQQTVQWWKDVATRYKDQPAVAGYDLMNEAYSAPFDDLLQLYDEVYREVRAIDPKHIIILEDGLQGFHRMPLPETYGWSNIIYSFHYYPQNAEEAIQAYENILPRFRRAEMYFGVPNYVGEFNTMQVDRGGEDAFQRYWEVFEFYGWPWTFWTYKKIEENYDLCWGLYGYVKESPVWNLETGSEEEIAAIIESLKTENTGINQLLKAAIQPADRWNRDLISDKEGAIQLDFKDAMPVPSEDGAIKIEWGRGRPNAGFWGKGDVLVWPFTVDKDGRYDLFIQSANDKPGNKVGIWLDGVYLGESELKNSEGWSLYITQNLGVVNLTAGKHVLQLSEADDLVSFINLRACWLEPTDLSATLTGDNQIWLTPFTMNRPGPKSPLRVEWLNDPPDIGYWAPKEKVEWTVSLTSGGSYTLSAKYATPDGDTEMTILIDGQETVKKALAPTKDWQTYSSEVLGTAELTPGPHIITALWDADHESSTGNLRDLKLDKAK